MFATHYLAGDARAWWNNIRAMTGGQMITWDEFKVKFSRTHVPPGLINRMRDEFRELKQGRMTVVEYRDKFLSLARYAPRSGYRVYIKLIPGTGPIAHRPYNM